MLDFRCKILPHAPSTHAARLGHLNPSNKEFRCNAVALDSVGGSYEPETAAAYHRRDSSGGMLHGKSMDTAYSRASVCVRTFVRASVALHGQRLLPLSASEGSARALKVPLTKG
jgi:hypothetical protein